MLDYIKARLAEHSTQIALSADFAMFLNALAGTVTWQTFGTALVGSLVAIVFPSRSATP